MAMFDRLRTTMRTHSVDQAGVVWLGERFLAQHAHIPQDNPYVKVLNWFQATLLCHDEKDPERHILVFDIDNIADLYIDEQGRVDNTVFGPMKLPAKHVWFEVTKTKVFDTRELGKAAVFMWESKYPQYQTLHAVYLREVPGSTVMIPLELAFICTDEWETDPFNYRYLDFTNIGEERAVDVIEQYASMQFMAFKCLMFLHTKNVQVIRQVQPIKVQQKREKANKLPLVDVRIVTVRPVLEKFEREVSQTADTQSTTPFHIVRGHFADYREKGLFGKYPGIYWIPQHSRGSLEHGTIKKRYTTPQHVTA